MIAKNSKEFIEISSNAIVNVLNGEFGQKLTNDLRAEMLEKNPNLTEEEWSVAKNQFIVYLFDMLIKGNKELMNEFGTHIYNELREEAE